MGVFSSYTHILFHPPPRTLYVYTLCMSVDGWVCGGVSGLCRYGLHERLVKFFKMQLGSLAALGSYSRSMMLCRYGLQERRSRYPLC